MQCAGRLTQAFHPGVRYVKFLICPPTAVDYDLLNKLRSVTEIEYILQVKETSLDLTQ